MPKNLKVLLAEKQEGYELRMAYVLVLKHHCMGTFPALTCESEQEVITVDPALLKVVGETLPPRPAKIVPMLACVNFRLGMGFLINGVEDWYLENSLPTKIFSADEIAALIAANPTPFKWAPGLVGPGMTREEFVETLTAAAQCDGP